MHFGNIREYKGLDILLKALKFVVNELEDVILVIAGKPWIDWGRYKKIINKEALEKHVIKKLDFIPPSDVEHYFAASDIVVLPYKEFESQSAVGALALPFKKPLIVTNVGSLPDFVKDKRVIAKSNDAEDLARKIIQVLNDKKLLEKSEKDLEELIEKYNWDKIAKKTIELYLGD